MFQNVYSRPEKLETKAGKIKVDQNKCNIEIESTQDNGKDRWFTLSAICTEMGKD